MDTALHKSPNLIGDIVENCRSNLITFQEYNFCKSESSQEMIAVAEYVQRGAVGIPFDVQGSDEKIMDRV
jgi:hypothetical protein